MPPISSVRRAMHLSKTHVEEGRSATGSAAGNGGSVAGLGTRSIRAPRPQECSLRAGMAQTIIAQVGP